MKQDSAKGNMDKKHILGYKNNYESIASTKQTVSMINSPYASPKTS